MFNWLLNLFTRKWTIEFRHKNPPDGRSGICLKYKGKILLFASPCETIDGKEFVVVYRQIHEGSGSGYHVDIEETDLSPIKI